MEKWEVAQWLRVTGKRIMPMRVFLDNVALHLDEGFGLDKDTKIEIAKKLQRLADFVMLEIEIAEEEGRQAPVGKEFTALANAIAELTPNIVQGYFTHGEDKTSILGLLPTA